MSVTFYVFMQKARIPDISSWQSALDQAGFPLDLGKDFDLKTHTGFLPTQYAGKNTGFEYFLEQEAQILSEISSSLPEIGKEIEDKPVCAEFDIIGDMDELAAAITAAATLAKTTGGVLFDAESGKTYEGDEAIESARETLREIKKG